MVYNGAQVRDNIMDAGCGIKFDANNNWQLDVTQFANNGDPGVHNSASVRVDMNADRNNGLFDEVLLVLPNQTNGAILATGRENLMVAGLNDIYAYWAHDDLYRTVSVLYDPDLPWLSKKYNYFGEGFAPDDRNFEPYHHHVEAILRRSWSSLAPGLGCGPSMAPLWNPALAIEALPSIADLAIRPNSSTGDFDSTRPIGDGQLGNAHYSPNTVGNAEYHRNEEDSAPSGVDKWAGYPNTFPFVDGRLKINSNGRRRYVTGNVEWGETTARAYAEWSISHFPRATGFLDGRYNDWRKYLMDVNDQFVMDPSHPNYLQHLSQASFRPPVTTPYDNARDFTLKAHGNNELPIVEARKQHDQSGEPLSFRQWRPVELVRPDVDRRKLGKWHSIFRLLRVQSQRGRKGLRQLSSVHGLRDRRSISTHGGQLPARQVHMYVKAGPSMQHGDYIVFFRWNPNTAQWEQVKSLRYEKPGGNPEHEYHSTLIMTPPLGVWTAYLAQGLRWNGASWDLISQSNIMWSVTGASQIGEP